MKDIIEITKLKFSKKKKKNQYSWSWLCWFIHHLRCARHCDSSFHIHFSPSDSHKMPGDSYYQYFIEVETGAERWRVLLKVTPLVKRQSGGVTVWLWSPLDPYFVLSPILKVSSSLTSFSSSGWISSFSSSPWRKVVVSSLCGGRHCGEHRGGCERTQDAPSPQSGLSQPGKKDPVPRRMKDPWRIPNYHLGADLAIL